LWQNYKWKDAVGDSADATVLEALRRAADLRDTLAEDGAPGSAVGRALYLVDVLNHLSGLMKVDTSRLWES
jgi:hypothetical protein